MSPTIRAGYFTILALVLAGCGGGGAISSLPGGDAGPRSPQYVVPTTPVLYVASQDRIEAFALTARGSTPPTRTIFVHANQTDRNASITTFIDGTLDVLQTYFPSAPPSPKCRIVVESATANGDAQALNPKFDCSAAGNSGVAYGIATNFVNSQVDVLYDDNGSANYTLERVAQGFGNGVLGPPNPITLNGAQPNLATNPSDGADWVNNGTTTLSKYSRTQTDASCGGTCTPLTVTTKTKGGTATTFLGAMAISNDGVLYVIASTGSGDHLLGYPVSALCNGCTVNATYDKSFASVTQVTAVAVGSDNNVYVGMTTASGARVKIYSPHPDDTGNPNPTGNLDALPGDGATIITSLNVYQP